MMKRSWLVLSAGLCCGLALVFALTGCQDLTTTPTAAGHTTVAPVSPSAVITAVTAPGPTATVPVGAVVWTNLNPSGAPSPREGQAMVYYGVTGRVYLFGGYDWTTYLDDTWAYDTATNTWTELSPAGSRPPARAYHSMACDLETGLVMLFGGVDDSGEFNDLWTYDPTVNTWTQLDPLVAPVEGMLPVVRAGGSMFYDADTGQLIVFGGQNGEYGELGDFWFYDSSENMWLDHGYSGDGPPARSHAAIAYSGSDNKAVLFGGYASGADLDDTWTYNPIANEWADLGSGGGPSARAFSAMEYFSDSNNEQMILFGGKQYSGEILRDTWAFDPEGLAGWTELSPAGEIPAGRAGHSLAYDSTRGRLIMFGGTNDDTLFNDTWSYGPNW